MKHDVLQHIGRTRTDGHPDRDFVAPMEDRVGDHSVNAEQGEQ